MACKIDKCSTAVTGEALSKLQSCPSTSETEKVKMNSNQLWQLCHLIEVRMYSRHERAQDTDEEERCRQRFSIVINNIFVLLCIGSTRQ